MNYKSLITVLGLISILNVLPASAQQFEVASVKPNTGAGRGMRIMGTPGGRFTVENMPLKALIAFAYKVRDYQISGGPGWIDSDRFDITAKAEGNAAPDQMGPMLQNLLADRFKLAIRRETKELPVYALVAAKGGIRLKPSQEGNCFTPEPNKPPPPPAPGANRQPPCGGMMMAPNQINAGRISMQQLLMALSDRVCRTVIDKTGFTGTFDLHLEWTPDESTGCRPSGFGPPGEAPPPPADSGPSIFTALQEQLGLRLESQKGPVEMIVIDHVEKPAEN